MTFLPIIQDGEGRFGVELPEPEPGPATANGESDRVTELREALRKAASRWPLPIPAGRPREEGHGHVREREDGAVMRCGGPNRCGPCEREQRDLRNGLLPTEFDAVLR